MDKGCDRSSTSSLKPVSSVFEALKTLLQLYGTACAPMLRADGRGVLDFVLRRFTKAQVERDFGVGIGLVFGVGVEPRRKGHPAREPVEGFAGCYWVLAPLLLLGVWPLSR